MKWLVTVREENEYEIDVEAATSDEAVDKVMLMVFSDPVWSEITNIEVVALDAV